MCSINDETEEEYMKDSIQLNLSKRKCNKCRTECPQIVLRSKDVYCKDCFLQVTTHKFKSLLGRHKVLRKNERVLVLIKIGHPSTTLLHFIHTGLELNSPKKLNIDPVFLFIEDNTELDIEDRKRILRSISDQFELISLPIYYTSILKYIFGKTDTILIEDYKQLVINNDDDTTIRNLLGPKLSSSVYAETLRQFHTRLLIDAAKKLNCTTIFTPEISANVASILLSDITLGRGSQLALNVGLIDDREPSAKIVRPLRLFDFKEVVFYNHYNQLNSVHAKVIGKKQNVQNLTEQFINKLQLNYPATVTTIVRIGDKFGSNKANLKNKCLLCKAPKELDGSTFSSSEAIRYSQLISEHSSTRLIFKQEDSKYCFSCLQLTTKH